MYAIVEESGFQYKVKKGAIVVVPKLTGKIGEEIKIPLLLFSENELSIIVGQPFVPNSWITANILNHVKEKKIKVFKKNRRKGYRRTQGHRQEKTKIKILDFFCEGIKYGT